MVYKGHFGLQGLWFGMSTAWLIATILYCILIGRTNWQGEVERAAKRNADAENSTKKHKEGFKGGKEKRRSEEEGEEEEDEEAAEMVLVGGGKSRRGKGGLLSVVVRGDEGEMQGFMGGESQELTMVDSTDGEE